MKNNFPTMEAKLQACQETVGYVFHNPILLQTALTHSSGATSADEFNERLEFLGDSVLGLIACDWLFNNYPQFREGQMTQLKSSLVSRNTCANWARQIDIQRFLCVANMGKKGANQLSENILADAFEALIGAIYLDGGFTAAREYALKLVRTECERLIQADQFSTAKTTLQAYSQKHFGVSPVYSTLDEQGPEHSRSFQVEVQLGSRRFPAAWGNSKKKAETLAAENALHELAETQTDEQKD
jgi:ribonuclease III